MVKLCGVVLCMVVVLMKENTEDRQKGVTVEAVTVRSIMEECA